MGGGGFENEMWPREQDKLFCSSGNIFLLRSKCVSLLCSFVNPGKVGDWKTMFTEEQDEYFNSVFKSRMENCALEFVWEEQQKET